MAIELVAAKCPCCGADIMLDNNLESGFCQYCGSRILVQAAVAFQRVVVEGTVKTKSADFIIKAGRLESYNGEDVDAVIPSNVIIIGEGSFAECIGLKSITIPNSVDIIEKAAFSECVNLESVKMHKGVTIIGELAFSECNSLTSVEIPESVVTIGDGAFDECSNLTSVTIPESVVTIGDSAFSGCSSLTSVIIPKSVTSIGRHIFSGCKTLTALTMSKSLYYDSYDGDKHLIADNLKALDSITFYDGEEFGVKEAMLLPECPLKLKFEEAIYDEKKKDQAEQWKKQGLCEFCGGPIRFHKCKYCGHHQY